MTESALFFDFIFASGKHKRPLPPDRKVCAAAFGDAAGTETAECFKSNKILKSIPKM